MPNTGARSCAPPLPAEETRPSFPTAAVITESFGNEQTISRWKRRVSLFKADDSGLCPRLCTKGALWPRHCFSFSWQTGGKWGGAVSRLTIRARCSPQRCYVNLDRAALRPLHRNFITCPL